MAELDTSGVVRLPQTVPPTGTWSRARKWEDLSPFAQGYVEAIFAGLEHPGYIDVEPGNTDAGHIPVGFRHLAPEALAMILRDCEERTWFHSERAAAPQMGAAFWRNRQAGKYDIFSPLCVCLNDAGKVMLEVAS